MLPDEIAVAKLVLEVAMPDVLTPVSWFDFFDGYRNWFFYSRIVGISWMVTGLVTVNGNRESGWRLY